MDKISSPKVPVEEILPIKPDEIQAIIDHCPAKTYMGDRDIAIMCLLLDTGARAEEFLNMNIADYNVRDGDILIRKGKGSKPRHVFVGLGSRKALRNWLKHRKDTCDAMWINNKGTRLEYGGLRGIIKRRGKNANVKASSIHDFRRSFAINFLRANPGEIMSLQKLMGHADLQILRRYLAQTTEDLKEAHMRGSPVDNFLHIR